MLIPLIHYLYPSGLPKYLHQHSNNEPSWALITGASDGIGLALAHALASRGFNVVIHGRNPAKLSRVLKELEAAHPERSFRTVAIDASSFTNADIDRIAAVVEDVPLAVLINNVGGTAPLTSNFKHFDQTTPDEIDALFSLNILFPQKLTRALLPRFQAQKTATLILNCGSQSAIGQAYVSAYSSTKGALHTWTRSLAAEQRSEGTKVDVMECIIAATYTQQFEGDASFKPGLFMPTAERMAKSVLARVGNGHVQVVAYFWHWIQAAFLYGLLPVQLADSIVANVLKPSVEARAS